MVGKSVQDGSVEAKDGIRWQDKKVPPKIQLGLVLDQLETLLRCFHFFLSTLLFSDFTSLYREIGMSDEVFYLLRVAKANSRGKSTLGIPFG